MFPRFYKFWKFVAPKRHAKVAFEQGLLNYPVIGWRHSSESTEIENLCCKKRSVTLINKSKDAHSSTNGARQFLFQTVSSIRNRVPNVLSGPHGGSDPALSRKVILGFTQRHFGTYIIMEKATKKAKEDQGEEEVAQKKKKTTKSAKNKEPVESESGTTTDVAPVKKTRAAAGTKESAKIQNGTDLKATKPKKTEAALTEETENKETKTATSRKAKTKADENEPGTSRPTRGARAKKETVEDTQEATKATTKAPPKGKKRQAAKAKEEEKEDEPESGKKAKGTTRTNANATAWDAIDFNCSLKSATGKSPNFRITSWNVDGIRAWMKKGGLDILKYDKPDVLCLQETKCSQEKLPEELYEVEGYEGFWCSSEKEGYAGVGILSKVKPLSIIEGINSAEHDEEGRCITAEFENFYVVNVYVPNAGRKLVTLPKRLDWNTLFKSFVKDLDKNKPVIVCGDMNVAHTEIDLANPKTNTKNAGFTVEEREGMTDFLQDGYIDTFRKLYPDKEKAYTFWTYMANARAKNVGWRLDYFIVSERFMENVCDNVIISEAFGSDHCPITLHFNV